MLRKNIFLLFLYFILTSCGYSPIYSVKDNNYINISIQNYEGDKEINSILISRLESHKNENSDLYKIEITTEYTKTDLSKSLTGKIENYQLSASTNFNITGENIEKNFSIKENFTMKNFDDDFEEKNYEKSIKENMANLIYRKLMIQFKKIK